MSNKLKGALILILLMIGARLVVRRKPNLAAAADPNLKPGSAAGGYAALVAGVQQEDIQGVLDAGAVNVIYGSAPGLTEAGNQFWNQESPGIPDTAEEDDSFGYRLAAGDFDGDGNADLAVSVYLEMVNGVADAGAVRVIYGTANGLSEVGNQF